MSLCTDCGATTAGPIRVADDRHLCAGCYAKACDAAGMRGGIAYVDERSRLESPVRFPVCDDAPVWREDEVEVARAGKIFYRALCSFIGGPKHGIIHEVQWPGEKESTCIRCLDPAKGPDADGKWPVQRVLIYEAIRSGDGQHVAVWMRHGEQWTGPKEVTAPNAAAAASKARTIKLPPGLRRPG